MEALLVIVALFVLIVFPIAILVNLSSIRESLDRLAESVRRAESRLPAEPKPPAENAEPKSRAQSAAHGGASSPSEPLLASMRPARHARPTE